MPPDDQRRASHALLPEPADEAAAEVDAGRSRGLWGGGSTGRRCNHSGSHGVGSGLVASQALRGAVASGWAAVASGFDFRLNAAAAAAVPVRRSLSALPGWDFQTSNVRMVHEAYRVPYGYRYRVPYSHSKVILHGKGLRSRGPSGSIYSSMVTQSLPYPTGTCCSVPGTGTGCGKMIRWQASCIVRGVFGAWLKRGTGPPGDCPIHRVYCIILTVCKTKGATSTKY